MTVKMIVNKIKKLLIGRLFIGMVLSTTLLLSTLFTPIMPITIITPSYAAIDVYEFDNERQEAQYRGLIEELRCPKCQNQNLAGSDAPIAQDLKQKVYDMVKEGRSDAEIRQYMHERYGDFISYKPPVRPSTWILWFFPPILLVLLIAGWLWRTKRRQSLIAHSSSQSAADIKTDAKVDTTKIDTTTDGLSTQEQAALDALLASHPDNYSNNVQADDLANTGEKS